MDRKGARDHFLKIKVHLIQKIVIVFENYHLKKVRMIMHPPNIFLKNREKAQKNYIF